ncbi:hypothetical protein [Streptomyces sp. KR80]|uniref:hypothetical protein n=1 Tax=Streptomyces sp. KR80 TaxID=3457426 RepID=UPI003FD52FE3
MPDYFDRLLARHAPQASCTAVRVRPRLPGPFERVEALRADPPQPDEPAPLFPAAPRPDVPARALVRHEREIRTDRHTVVRTEAVPREEPDRPVVDAARTAAPLLRPATPVTPLLRSVPPEAPRAGRRAASPAADASPWASAPKPAPADGNVAPLAAPAPPRPRAADATAARGAARAAAARRGGRPAERVVHVQIGRLEVSAAGGPGANRPAGARSEPSGRRAPAMSLDDFLTRGEKRN